MEASGTGSVSKWLGRATEKGTEQRTQVEERKRVIWFSQEEAVTAEAVSTEDLRHVSRCGRDEVRGQGGARHRDGKVKCSVSDWDLRSPQTLGIRSDIICFKFIEVGSRKSGFDRKTGPLGLTVGREDLRMTTRLCPSNPRDGVALEDCRWGWLLDLGRHRKGQEAIRHPKQSC